MGWIEKDKRRKLSDPITSNLVQNGQEKEEGKLSGKWQWWVTVSKLERAQLNICSRANRKTSSQT